MNFGKWIVVAFVLFAMFIATLVTVCVRQDMPLVTRDYYDEELKYQDQIERQENTNALADLPQFTVEDRQLTLEYPLLSSVERGEVKLFRPSDPDLDQSFKIVESSSTTQSFDVADAEPGLYRARMTWTQEGREYYFEKIVIL